MEQTTVAVGGDEKVFSVFCVHFSGNIFDKNICRGTASDPHESSKCISSKCKSVFKICYACKEQGEIKRIGYRPEICCELGKDLCSFHLENGEGKRRTPDEVRRLGKIKTNFDISGMLVDKRQILQRSEAAHDSLESIKTAGSVMLINRDRIRPCEKQPRKHFSIPRLHDLANSIKEIGQKTPIVVKPLPGNSDFDWELVDGERRFRACGIAKIPNMRAIIEEHADEKSQFMSSVAMNFNREDHTPMEIALAINRIKEEHGFSEEKIGTIFGKSGVWVNSYSRLLKLHPKIQEMLDPEISDKEQIGLSTAMYLAMQEDNQERQLVLATEIVGKKMKTNHAYAFIREKAAPFHSDQRKNSQKGRARRPSDDFYIIRDLVVRTKSNLNLQLKLGEDKIREIFEHRPFDDRQPVCDHLLEIENKARELRKIISDLI